MSGPDEIRLVGPGGAGKTTIGAALAERLGRTVLTCDNPSMRTRLLPALSIFSAGVVYAVLPRGTFGPYDIAARAAVTGAAAAVTCLLILTLRNRLGRPPS